MNPLDLLKYAFAAGVAYAIFRQFGKDLNGIGNCVRAEKAKSERRWKMEIANEIEELEPKEKAKRIAERLRHDAYRDT